MHPNPDDLFPVSNTERTVYLKNIMTGDKMALEQVMS